MSNKKYKCTACGEIFDWYDYNAVDFSTREPFFSCPECKSNLVPDYNYKITAKLNSISIWVIVAATPLIALSSLIWTYKSVGVWVLTVAAIPIVGINLIQTYYIMPSTKNVVQTRIKENNDI